MPNLSELTHEQFERCLAQTFVADPGDGDPLTLELTQVEKRGTFDPEVHPRQAFSLVFRGPMEPVLAQRIYPLHNEALGDLELFLVPIGPDAHGMCYEAVFT